MSKAAGARRRVAKRPPARFVEVELEGEFDGWWARCRADFSTSLIAELQSQDIDEVLAALAVIIVEHNMPNSEGELAEHLRDVDPYIGLGAMLDKLTATLQKLPPR